MSTFKLPDLGEGLAEAEIVEWHVKVGEQVRVDQPMVSVETAKAVVEVPAPFSGTVTALRGKPGDIIPTGAPLIDFDSGTVVGVMPDAPDEHPEDLGLPGAAPSNGSAARPRALPAARALARHLGVDLGGIEGSGRAGIICFDDVLRQRGADAAPSGADSGFTAAGCPEPLRGLRRAMAQSMAVSRDQVAGSTVCDDADIHAWNDRGDYMLRLLRALVAAWRAEPALNAWYDPLTQARVLIDHIDVGIAVDTPAGLIVPVLRNIDRLTSEQLRTLLAQRKDAAHARSTPAEDLRGSTLMLSNFGTLAGRYGIPRVMPPAVAILGAGKVREDAVVVGGGVVAHRRMPLSLSFDHRCITGGEACRFLAGCIADLEKPD